MRAQIHPLTVCILALGCSILWIAAPPAYGQYAELGKVEFENSGSPEAQESFLKGVAALHSFWYGEARFLFQEAQAADPDFALAYWGEAMTHDHPLWSGHDEEAGRQALAKLAPTPEERAAKAPTAREKAWLATVEALYGEGSRSERQQAYHQAVLDLANRYPQDQEASAFYALTLQTSQHSGLASVRHRMRSAAILERLMDTLPRHPGVLHYLIHAYDDPIHAPLGLRPALVYAGVAPGSSHALHMPSHIFLQLGLWDSMVSSNEASYVASLAWTQRRDLPATERDFHSLGWLSYGYLQLGRTAEGKECVRLMQEVVDASGDTDLAAEAQRMEARYLVESGRWSEAPEASAVLTDNPYSEANMRLALALAAAYGQDAPAAAAAAARLEELRAGREEEGNRYLERLLAIMERQGAALAAVAAGNWEAALERGAEAARLADTTDPSSGPPETLKPAHELYGELLWASGRPAEAVEPFQRALERAPNRVASLLGLARAAVAQGDDRAAAAQYRQLLDLWKEADPDLPALAEARAALARVQEASGDDP